MSHSLIIRADARAIPLRDESVDCCVTSPPYWGLRDYGTARWEGGDPVCTHKPKIKPRDTRPSGLLGGGTETVNQGTVQRDCHCGASRVDTQLGLERTPEEYVANMVAVFREVRRVLKRDGTCWIVIGDSYAGGGNYRGVNSESTLTDKQRSNRGARGLSQELGAAGKDFGLAAKQLIGIPWRVAFALQADGWWLRKDNIWAKPNPMPESVTDRTTSSHEYVFHLSKSARYYYDAEAVAEPTVGPAGPPRKDTGGTDGYIDLGMNHGRAGCRADGLRNRRSVWTIATQPYRGAHFATYPEKLARICILAGCPPGGIVLDPFAGSGTTGKVSVELGRDAVLCDIAFQGLQVARLQKAQPTLPLADATRANG